MGRDRQSRPRRRESPESRGRRVRRNRDRDRQRSSRRSPRRTPPLRVVGSPRRGGYQTTDADRLERLETLVERLVRRESESVTENSNTGQCVRMTIKADCIPQFSPGDPNLTSTKWLDKIEQLAQINRWDDSVKIYHMQSRLKGLARTWYEHLTTYAYTWEEWKRLIIRTFPDHRDFSATLKALVARVRKPGESMTQYYFAKMDLLQACNIGGKEAVSCLIDGIGDRTVQSSAKAGRYENPEVLYQEFLSTITDNELQNPEKYPRLSFDKRRLGRRESPKRFKPNPKRDDNLHLHKDRMCYNCREVGHVSTQCPKPRNECTRCKLLGHDEKNCKKKINRSEMQVKLIDSQTGSNSCYFVDCLVNGKPSRAYVDNGCSVVTIRESDAIQLGLPLTKSTKTLRGYGGGFVPVLGETKANLTVDLVEAEVDMLIVDDSTQIVPVLVGQAFLNQANVTVLIKNGELRLFDSALAALPEVEDLPPKKILLWSQKAVVIPPRTVSYVEVGSDETIEWDEVYVDTEMRSRPGNEHDIPACITTTKNGVIAVRNMSPEELAIPKATLMARGQPCRLETSANEVSDVLSLACTYELFTADDIAPLIDAEIPEEYRQRLLNLLNEHRDCFSQSTRELGKTDVVKMQITLTDDKPVTYKPYRLSFLEREVVRDIVQDLLDNGIIQESTSPYSSPILLVKKKTGEYRMCVDFRALNSKTRKDQYPIPRVDDYLDRIQGSKFFTTLDLASGYHQIAMSTESVPKTAFITPDGHYEYLRMPFGLVNAPAVFQRTINSILGNERFTSAMAYLDDILLPSKDIESGLKLLAAILKLFRKAGMTFRLSKCNFLRKTIEYLGHELSGNGIQPGKTKTRAVNEYPRPMDKHQVRQFVGLTSYFRKFVKGFAALAKPLTKLTKLNAPFEWGAEQEEAFQKLKGILVQRPVLALYNREAETELHTDACKNGIGGILLQRQDDSSLKPVCYYSRQTTDAERRYHSYEQETLAVVESVRQFRVYLLGIRFKIVTDCNALRTTWIKRDLVPRIGRWWLAVQEFDFTVEYRPGHQMVHADALSRNALSSTDDKDAEENTVFHVGVNEDDWILAAQMKDDTCKQIREILLKEATNAEEREIHKEYTLQHGRVFKKTPNGKRWMVPKTARMHIVFYHHDNMGHFGLEKTLELIRSKYWFSQMRKYTKRYIECCLACLYNKETTGKRPGYLHPIEKYDVPLHTLHLDHLGPFVQSTTKNAYIIIAVDGFTKFLFAKAVRTTRVGPVLVFLDGIFDVFGVPKRLICDRGSCFTSQRFAEYCRQLGIRVTFNATATPRANGQAERYNRTILAALSSSSDDERTWDKRLKQVRWGINTTKNKTTGKTPYELMMGYQPRQINDAFLSNEVCDNRRNESLTETREVVAARIREQQAAQKERYDEKRKSVPKYEQGQLVLVRKIVASNDGRSRKLLQKFSGPYEIVKILDNDRVVVRDLPGATRSQKPYEGIVAYDKLKLYETAVESEDELTYDDDTTTDGASKDE